MKPTVIFALIILAVASLANATVIPIEPREDCPDPSERPNIYSQQQDGTSESVSHGNSATLARNQTNYRPSTLGSYSLWVSSSTTSRLIGSVGNHASSTASITTVNNVASTTAAVTTSALSTIAKSTASSFAEVPSLGWKAGLSGFPTIEVTETFNDIWLPVISWYSNYNPVAPNIDAVGHTVVGAPMLWGDGNECGDVDSWRMRNFTTYVENVPTNRPDVFFGYYEPDWPCSDSSDIDVSVAYSQWTQLIEPLFDRGIPIGSPPMATQLSQSWLSEFQKLGAVWNITSIHVNKPNATEAKKVVSYYWETFKKPIWVSELTCVQDQGGWSSCGSQQDVYKFLDEIIPWLEEQPFVIAYGANNGAGVPGYWDLMTNDNTHALTDTGRHYLSILQAQRAKRKM